MVAPVRVYDYVRLLDDQFTKSGRHQFDSSLSGGLRFGVCKPVNRPGQTSPAPSLNVAVPLTRVRLVTVTQTGFARLVVAYRATSMLAVPAMLNPKA